MSAFCFITLSAQKTFLIGGKVVDSATRQPLGGASVFAQNTTQGTTSNADGVFVMRLPNGGYDLIISYTGYETRSIRISNRPRATQLSFHYPRQIKLWKKWRLLQLMK